jgi:DNA modification methylase
VLDPFLGSGTTAEACIVEGFHCIGIEQDEGHVKLIKKRLSKPIQPVMFG